jgi:HEAT repeat protein
MGSIGKLVKGVLGGGSAAFENKVGLSPAKLDELLALLKPLNDFGTDLCDRLLRYLLDGVEDDSALSQLAGAKDAAQKLQLLCATQYGMPHADKNWARFLKPVEPVGPAFYLRLAKMFEAAARSLPADRFFAQPEFDNALWLEILLQEGTQTQALAWSSAQRSSALSGPLIETMLKADGRDPAHFLTAPFKIGKQRIWQQNQMREMVLRVTDIGKSWADHRDLIAPFLAGESADIRLRAVENLVRSGASVEAFVAELVVAATGDSKRVREATEPLLAKATAAARPLLEAAARDGSRAEREQAVRLLGNLCGEGSRPFLEERLAAETSAPVKEAIEKMLGIIKPVQGFAQEPAEAPPHVPLPVDSTVTPELRACLATVFNEFNEYAARHNDLVAKNVSKMYIHPPGKLDFLKDKELDEACRLLQNGGDILGHFSKTLVYLRLHDPEAKGGLRAFLEHPDCHLIHVVRFLAMINELGTPTHGHHGMMWQVGFRISTWRKAHEPKITLRHVAEALRQVGLSEEILVNDMLSGFQRSFEWEPEAVWPFLESQLPRIQKALEPSTGDWLTQWRHRQEFDGALRILSKFPQVPPALIGRLWDLATGTVKADRLRAQKAIDSLPDLQERVAQSLASGSFQTRSIAADWLGRLGDKQAVPVLAAAARKEKQDATFDVMLAALEKLGEPIEPYLDRDKLAADAAKGLKKGIPEALDWFPWAGLPQVHWSDTKEEMPADVVKWLIVQNFKQKSAEAGPLLRRYCEMIVPAEREELGRFVFTAWLNQDLKRKLTDAEARAQARQQAPQMWQMYQQSLQWYQQNNQTPPAGFQNKTQAQVEEDLFAGLCRECGSAVAEKGVLAVAGACGSDGMVPPVQKYLKEWYGYRAAQCKALIAMLSAVDRPAAIQYLLSIANRFRTKGIREEAEKYVNVLAERKGWTLDELADRTMPTAGFDDDGSLELNFGPRQFAARVNSDLEAVLTDAAGKVFKNLPDPRQDDDAELAKAAKATFSAAKKELKKFAGMQTTRLYEAMCTERTWSVADWQMYLMGHPLLKFLCQRLVWAAYDGHKITATFRPLDDGTLTDCDDKEVALAEGSTIRIAHGCQLSDVVAEKWKKHLSDYDVSPLFTQFGRVPYALPAEKQNETSIDDFQGYMVEAFKLRGFATKSGYTRGQTQDGGWFYDYQKTFPGLGLKVQLGFSGNGLPEENRQVALTSLSFQKSAPEESGFMLQSGSLPLSEIPAVLVTECYNDLAAIAKSGSGFDPEWEKKVH